MTAKGAEQSRFNPSLRHGVLTLCSYTTITCKLECSIASLKRPALNRPGLKSNFQLAKPCIFTELLAASKHSEFRLGVGTYAKCDSRNFASEEHMAMTISA
jgi:hypothetical protein